MISEARRPSNAPPELSGAGRVVEERVAFWSALADEQGRAGFTPKEGNYYLVVAHHEEPGESGKGYQSTKYSATLTVLVPQVCPCCGE